MAKRITKGNLWGFIQSRPYASVADIRRTFAMDVESAASVPTGEGACYVGLPQEAADLIRQLWHEGRIVLDLNPDVKARVVQGLYPARVPLGRQPAPPAAARDPAARRGGGGAPEAEPAASGAGQSALRKRRRRRKRRSLGEAGAVEGVDPPPAPPAGASARAPALTATS